MATEIYCTNTQHRYYRRYYGTSSSTVDAAIVVDQQFIVLYVATAGLARKCTYFR